jgi:hypothetical protein
MNPFTRALTPPFIGRRRDFYIPKTPSHSKNIPNVNTYINVFFISYIYKPATSSHPKPGLLGRQLRLCFSLVREFPCSWLPNQTSDIFLNFRLLKFVTSPVRDYRLSHVRDSEVSQVQASWKSRVRDPEDSPVRDSRKSHVRDSEASQIQDSWKSRMLCPWKTHLKNFVKLDVSRVTGFPEFSNNNTFIVPHDLWISLYDS